VLIGPDDLAELMLDSTDSLVDYFGKFSVDGTGKDVGSENVEILLDTRISCHKLAKFIQLLHNCHFLPNLFCKLSNCGHLRLSLLLWWHILRLNIHSISLNYILPIKVYSNNGNQFRQPGKRLNKTL
jgi:hypothetical protein